MPVSAPLLPQIRVFKIDLKVWGSPPAGGDWMGGEKILEEPGWGKNFVWVEQGLP